MPVETFAQASASRTAIVSPYPNVDNSCDGGATSCIVTDAGDKWTLVKSGGTLGQQAVRNGTVDPSTSNVVELVWVDGVLYMEATQYHDWWKWDTTIPGWTQLACFSKRRCDCMAVKHPPNCPP